MSDQFITGTVVIVGTTVISILFILWICKKPIISLVPEGMPKNMRPVTPPPLSPAYKIKMPELPKSVDDDLLKAQSLSGLCLCLEKDDSVFIRLEDSVYEFCNGELTLVKKGDELGIYKRGEVHEIRH